MLKLLDTSMRKTFPKRSSAPALGGHAAICATGLEQSRCTLQRSLSKRKSPPPRFLATAAGNSRASTFTYSHPGKSFFLRPSPQQHTFNHPCKTRAKGCKYKIRDITIIPGLSDLTLAEYGELGGGL